jgi:hypothetical protein
VAKREVCRYRFRTRRCGLADLAGLHSHHDSLEWRLASACTGRDALWLLISRRCNPMRDGGGAKAEAAQHTMGACMICPDAGAAGGGGGGTPAAVMALCVGMSSFMGAAGASGARGVTSAALRTPSSISSSVSPFDRRNVRLAPAPDACSR